MKDTLLEFRLSFSENYKGKGTYYCLGSALYQILLIPHIIIGYRHEFFSIELTELMNTYLQYIVICIPCINMKPKSALPLQSKITNRRNFLLGKAVTCHLHRNIYRMHMRGLQGTL